MTVYPNEVQELDSQSQPITCSLEKICDWGGNSRICCLSCPKLDECTRVCDEAQNVLIKGVDCPHRGIEVTES